MAWRASLPTKFSNGQHSRSCRSLPGARISCGIRPNVSCRPSLWYVKSVPTHDTSAKMLQMCMSRREGSRCAQVMFFKLDNCVFGSRRHLERMAVTHACTTPGDGSRDASAPCCARGLHTCIGQQQLQGSASHAWRQPLLEQVEGVLTLNIRFQSRQHTWRGLLGRSSQHFPCNMPKSCKRLCHTR